MKSTGSRINNRRGGFGSLFSAIMSILILSACSPQPPITVYITPFPLSATEAPAQQPTALATRPVYQPGTLVAYTARTGDNLPALAHHFNTTVKEILENNPQLSEKTTTLTPGENLQIPIYYEALWGNPFQIIPDSLYINGPAQIGFDTKSFVNAHPGWLKNYASLAGGEVRRGADLIDYVSLEYSISPRLLLALAEYQAGALSVETLEPQEKVYPLGYEDEFHQGFYLQLLWAANTLNNGYYSWRSGKLGTITRLDGSIEHPDPWQNAATVALQNYFSQVLPVADYHKAIYSEGLYNTYAALFGDPWQHTSDHIPGDLQQPALRLPFVPGKTWSYTGGPHSAWGEGAPLAALDFAPPSVVGGCAASNEFVTAMADGQIVRSEKGLAMLDLDGDGDEHTGWVILYLHLGLNDKIRPGMLVKTGDLIGHPSCEGGSATGTHVHIARKYNGEWIEADSVVPFNLEGWVAKNGTVPYQGSLSNFGRVITASDKGLANSYITAGNP